MVKLSDNYTVAFQYQLHIVDVPKDRWLTETEAKPLRLMVNTTGFNLLKINYLESNVRELDISLLTVPYRKTSNDRYYILIENLFPVLASDLNVEESNLETSVTEINFVLEGQLSVDLPVILRQNIRFKEQFGGYGPAKIDPEFVKVYGSESVLDTMQAIYTEILTLKGIDESISENVQLSFNPKLVIPEFQEVKVDLTVERFTENALTIPVLKPLNSRIKLFPENVQVFFQVAMKDFNLVNSNHFTISADTSGIATRQKFLPVKLINSPENIRFSRIEPSQLEYLIVK